MTSAPQVSMDDLREFAVFAQHLSFTRAAEELHLSQPALHVKIRKLGERLGCRLYAREGRRLVLTSEGEATAAVGRRAEFAVRDLLSTLASPAPDTVSVAAGEGAHLYVIGPAIRRLLDAGSQLRLLNMDAASAVHAVREQKVDVGVTVGKEVSPSLKSTLLGTYPQMLAARSEHPLARRRSISIGELDSASLVVPPPGRPLRLAIDNGLRAANARTHVAIEAEGWQAMLRFVELGVGMAIVNGCVDAPPGISLRPIRDLPSVTYRAVYRRQAFERPAVDDVVRALQSGAP